MTGDGPSWPLTSGFAKNAPSTYEVTVAGIHAGMFSEVDQVLGRQADKLLGKGRPVDPAVVEAIRAERRARKAAAFAARSPRS